MAGGKLSPRQKMINLMYLIFIAMLALNMSKEVLSAFGNINEDLVEANKSLSQKSEAALAGLEQKAEDKPDQFKDVYARAKLVDQYSSAYYNYLAGIKNDLEGSVEDPKEYETMDKGTFLEEKMVNSGNLTDYGQKFMNKMEEYKSSMLNVMDSIDDTKKYEGTIKEKFSGEPIEDNEGVEKSYINYHFIGFPLISSITKITTMQNRVKRIENELFSQMLAGQLTQVASMSNYETLLQTSKGAYYQGEKFDGSIVLGRTDKSTVPQQVDLKVDGRKLIQGTDYVIEEGQVKLNVTAGNAGDHKIEGKLTFMQDGKPLDVKVDQSFQVIPKPNQAIVSADKMDVVYQGIENPMTVSMPGVPKNKITANVSGNHKWRNVDGSKYIVEPGTGKELKINVTGVIDGKKYPSSATFRIKPIPSPTPTVRGQIQRGGPIKMPRQSLKVSPIGATFENFQFDLKPVVKQFAMKVPGQPSIVVNGNKLNDKAKGLLDLASNGDNITILNVKADVPGTNVKNMQPIIVQITN